MRSKAVIQRILTWCERDYASKYKDGSKNLLDALEVRIHALQWVL